MSDPHIDTGTTAAFRQSWRRAGLRDILARTIAANPDYDEAALMAEMWIKINAGWQFVGAPGANQALTHAVFSYWFENNYRSYLRGLDGAPPRRRRQPVQAAQPAQQAQADAVQEPEAEAEPEAQPTPAQEAATATEARRSALRAAIEARITTIVLDMMMPNGKPLRDNTREELDETIAWQQRIRDRLQPGQTPDEAGLTEEEVRDLL